MQKPPSILASISLSALLLLSGCGNLKTATVPVPEVRTERVSVPAELLRHQCVGVMLSGATTYAELEDVGSRLWICVQDLNATLDKIGALK